MIIYYAENKERIDTSNKIRYEENKYTINLQKKEYAKAHKEETSLYQHQYYMENRDDLLEYQKEYRKIEENKVKIQERETERRKNVLFRIRASVSGAIYQGLKRTGKSKDGDSSIKYLDEMIGGDYISLLWAHIENQFEWWMTRNNQGQYIRAEWDDNDPSTWRWQLDHIIPHSEFDYELGDEQFQKCWALSNLRPLSAKQNIIDGASGVRHSK
jgi:hypothetical protein